ncbi:hypothetical protein L1049_003389 [Liquidambar formosana]|uniref:Uncharacterized protein n=1 Tax=Liquidambar formosana TaxID=63359 RepID=A0AAP0R4C2_LIQFO
MQRIRQLSLQTLETIDEVDRLAPIGVPVIASTPPCEPPSTSTHSKPSLSYARLISVRASTSVPPPSPHWPADASTPFHGLSSSYAPSLYGLYTSVPPWGLPAAFSLVHAPASSFAPSPQVGPSTFMLDVFIEDYRTPPNTVRLSSLSAFTLGHLHICHHLGHPSIQPPPI